MPRPVIRLGDKTSHGGTVVGAAPHTDSLHILVARLGDATDCPLHGCNPIVTGDPTVIVDGKPLARSGDRTACGAVLIPSQDITVDML